MNAALRKVTFVLEYLCLAGGAWFAGIFIYIALRSMPYGFPLEWMEGQNVDVIKRAAEGLPLYVEPSLEYVPFIYTPLYYYVSAFVSLFTGVSFFTARLVSFLSALGSGTLIYAWVRRERGNRMAAGAGAGLFFATYPLSARWFDVARIDSLFLLLTIAGLYVFYHYRGSRAACLAAGLFTAAFFTKQTALMIIAPVLAVGLWKDRVHTLTVIGLLAVFLFALILIFDVATDHWFSFYTFTVPAGHPIDRRFWKHFWRVDMRPLYVLLAMGTVLLAGLALRDRGKALGYAALALGCIGASYASRLHSYGYLNDLMPAHLFLALLGGLSLALAGQLRYRWLPPLAALLLLGQMQALLYNPKPLIPGPAAEAKGERFLEGISQVQGDIFMPDLQFVQERVGKKSYDFGMAAFDILRSNLKEKNYIKGNLRRELAQAIRSQRFGGIVPGHFVFSALPQLQRYYRFQRNLQFPREYLAGAVSFPQMGLWTPIPGAARP